MIRAAAWIVGGLAVTGFAWSLRGDETPKDSCGNKEPKGSIAKPWTATCIDTGATSTLADGDPYEYTTTTKLAREGFEAIVAPQIEGPSGSKASGFVHADGITINHGWAIGRLPFIRTSYVSIGTHGSRPGVTPSADTGITSDGLVLVELVYKRDTQEVEYARHYLLDWRRYEIKCNAGEGKKSVVGRGRVVKITPPTSGQATCTIRDPEDICSNSNYEEYLKKIDVAISASNLYPQFEPCEVVRP